MSFTVIRNKKINQLFLNNITETVYQYQKYQAKAVLTKYQCKIRYH